MQYVIASWSDICDIEISATSILNLKTHRAAAQTQTSDNVVGRSHTAVNRNGGV